MLFLLFFFLFKKKNKQKEWLCKFVNIWKRLNKHTLPWLLIFFFPITICWLYVFNFFQSKEGKSNTKEIHNMNGVFIPWSKSCHIDFAGYKNVSFIFSLQHKNHNIIDLTWKSKKELNFNFVSQSWKKIIRNIRLVSFILFFLHYRNKRDWEKFLIRLQPSK